jgi:hypothetical protein
LSSIRICYDLSARARQWSAQLEPLFVNCFYVPLLSCLVTGEMERYRFLVESFMWIVVAATIRQLAIRRRAGAAPLQVVAVR